MATLTISTSDLQKMLNTENSDVVLLTKREYKELLKTSTFDFLENDDIFDNFYKEAILSEEEKHQILIDSQTTLQTIEAIEECERILKDPTVKGYNSIEELKEALEND